MKRIFPIVRMVVFVVGLLFAGALFGPVIYAAITAYNYERTDLSTSMEATMLVDAYRGQLAPNILFLSIIPPPDGEECGYEPKEVFPEASEQLGAAIDSEKYDDYVGYYNLDRWRNDTRDKDYIDAITEKIVDDLSPYKIAFLRRCIQYTAFSKFCAEEISEFSDRVERFDHDRKNAYFGMGYEDEIVCTYVDGVAAKKGINLVDRNPK